MTPKGETTPSDWRRLLLVAAVWLAAAWLLTQYGAPLLPRWLASRLTLQSFLTGVLLVTTGLGLALSFALLPRARELLGLTRPNALALLSALLAAPLVLVISLYLGFELALPTLLEEIARGGRQAAQRNTGAFGRELQQAQLLTTLLWATVVTPIAEELLFRGALWSAVARLTQRQQVDRADLPEGLLDQSWAALAYRRTGRWLRQGGVATLATAALFAWLHADQAGGAGIVRVVQTSCLGLVLGLARQASGSVAPAILLHAGFNLLSLAKLRRWIGGEIWPHPLPIPLLFWQLGAVCLALLLLVGGIQLVRHRRRQTTSPAPSLPRPPADAEDGDG